MNKLVNYDLYSSFSLVTCGNREPQCSFNPSGTRMGWVPRTWWTTCQHPTSVTSSRHTERTAWPIKSLTLSSMLAMCLGKSPPPRNWPTLLKRLLMGKEYYVFSCMKLHQNNKGAELLSFSRLYRQEKLHWHYIKKWPHYYLTSRSIFRYLRKLTCLYVEWQS